MLKKLKSSNKGFTIIEVLIVLAIAALILLIVFLAVPALQRNARNNSRNNDASRVVAAITECLANHNGITGSCNSAAEINVGTLNQLTTAPALGNGHSIAQAQFQFAQQCNAEGDDQEPSTGRNFSVTYRLEPDDAVNDRCIAG